MREIKELISKNKKVYIYLSSEDVQSRFMSDAENQGITFGDGIKPTERKPDDIMALLSDGTICYLGWAGHMCYRHNHENVIRVDYEKFINEEKEYIIHV